MGNRAVIQLKTNNELSPALYLHWDGGRAREIIKRAEARMQGCPDGDIQYSFARLVQEAVNIDDPYTNTGYGVWNQTTELTEADSHGGAGCFVVDVSKMSRWKIKHFR